MQPSAGQADPRLSRALVHYGAHPTPQSRAEVLAALVDAQVLAALTAVATGRETAASGLPAESGAELSLMLVEAADGSRALPVFSDLEAMRHWRIDARPIPLTGAQACATAGEQGAQHLIVDPMGAAVVLEPAETSSLAAGWVPVLGSNLSSSTTPRMLTVPTDDIDPQLGAALRSALDGEPVWGARLLQGPDGLVLGVAPRQPLDPAALADLAQRIARSLGDALPDGGLGLVQVARRGPGVPVGHRAGWFRRRSDARGI